MDALRLCLLSRNKRNCASDQNCGNLDKKEISTSKSSSKNEYYTQAVNEEIKRDSSVEEANANLEKETGDIYNYVDSPEVSYHRNENTSVANSETHTDTAMTYTYPHLGIQREPHKFDTDSCKMDTYSHLGQLERKVLPRDSDNVYSHLEDRHSLYDRKKNSAERIDETYSHITGKETVYHQLTYT